MSDTQIIRRIIERGWKRANTRMDSEFIDIFQHALDELERIVHPLTTDTCPPAGDHHGDGEGIAPAMREYMESQRPENVIAKLQAKLDAAELRIHQLVKGIEEGMECHCIPDAPQVIGICELDRLIVAARGE